MGSLVYGSAGTQVDFDDRVLAHLQIVISSKLRRRESFMLSWRDSRAVGDGRSAIWIDAAIPLFFRYSGSRMPSINKEWLEALSMAAGSSHGLTLFDENGDPDGALAQQNSIKHGDHSLNRSSTPAAAPAPQH